MGRVRARLVALPPEPVVPQGPTIVALDKTAIATRTTNVRARPDPSSDMAGQLAVDATVAVTAHGLLSAMGAIETALNLLRQRYGVIAEDEFRAVVGSAERQARLVGGVLKDLVRGLPTGTLALLDELSGGQATA